MARQPPVHDARCGRGCPQPMQQHWPCAGDRGVTSRAPSPARWSSPLADGSTCEGRGARGEGRGARGEGRGARHRSREGRPPRLKPGQAWTQFGSWGQAERRRGGQGRHINRRWSAAHRQAHAAARSTRRPREGGSGAGPRLPTQPASRSCLAGRASNATRARARRTYAWQTSRP
eukprot:SAG25_NODE_623_length_6389_cov_57.880763_2_plen_175_part_00